MALIDFIIFFFYHSVQLPSLSTNIRKVASPEDFFSELCGTAKNLLLRNYTPNQSCLLTCSHPAVATLFGKVLDRSGLL